MPETPGVTSGATLTVPLAALIPHNALIIDEMEVEFDAHIQEHETKQTDSQSGGLFSGWQRKSKPQATKAHIRVKFTKTNAPKTVYKIENHITSHL